MPLLFAEIVWTAAYLVGAIPFGYLVARARGVDIFAQGSGNIGATNVGRVLGRPFGILVFLLDFAKGAGPVLIASQLPREWFEAGGTAFRRGGLEVGAGLAAFLGHVYPIYLGFRGGKGVATGLGVVVVLFPPLAVTAALLTWFATVVATRYVSLASILAVLALLAVHLGLAGDIDITDPRTLFALCAGALVIVKHRANLRRLREGTESQLKEHRAMQPIARSLHVLSLGLWCGTTIFFSFVVALSLFNGFEQVAQLPAAERPAWFPLPADFARADDTLKGPKEQGSRAAGLAVGGIFPWYFLVQGLCGLVAFATSLGWIGAGRLHRRRVWIVGLALALVLAGWPIEQEVLHLREVRSETREAYLRAQPSKQDEIRPALVAADRAFGGWHTVSLFVNLGVVVLVVIGTALAGELPASPRPEPGG
jgi:acyl-phosphate glycerol 3-phosphate acyltransferase